MKKKLGQKQPSFNLERECILKTWTCARLRDGAVCIIYSHPLVFINFDKNTKAFEDDYRYTERVLNDYQQI